MKQESNITCLEDVAAYLKRMCQPSQLSTGHVRFVPLNAQQDLSHEVAAYLRSAPEHRVSATERLGFVSFTMENLARLNAQLPEALELNLTQISKVGPRRG